MLEAAVDEQERRADRLGRAFAEHYPTAFRLAYLLTGDPHEAEDLAQEAFVRLAGRFSHLRRADTFGSYLRRTVLNLHTSRLRRLVRRRALERSAREATTVMPDVATNQDLWAAIATLPPRQRAALILRYYVDLSERETANEMRCSVAAVKSLVSRAIEAIRARTGGELQ